MLTPLDIHNKEFKRSFRGYNEDEIDDFLDQVVNDYEKLFRENDNLKEELARMKKDNAQYQKLENNLKETLLIAQKTANEVTDTAKQHAENLRESTAKECQNMRRDAEISARQMVEAADHQVKSATVEYCRLVEAKSQFLYQIKAALESELAVLHDAIESKAEGGRNLRNHPYNIAEFGLKPCDKLPVETDILPLLFGVLKRVAKQRRAVILALELGEQFANLSSLSRKPEKRIVERRAVYGEPVCLTLIFLRVCYHCSFLSMSLSSSAVYYTKLVFVVQHLTHIL